LDGLLQSRDDESSTSSHQFVDVFRWLHPTTSEAYTNWCTVTGARATNYGCRLDYIIADVGLVPSFVSCDIMAEMEGSDHCPVRAAFDVCVKAAGKCPHLCTKYLPQFAGRQQTLAAFFEKRTSKHSELRPTSSHDESRSSQDESRMTSGYDSQRSSSQHSSLDLLTSVSVPSLIETAKSSASASQLGKRPAVTYLTNVSSYHDTSKKLKLSDNLASGENKQSSLLTFFSKQLQPNVTCCEPATPMSQSAVTDTNSIRLTLEQKNDGLSQEFTDTDAASKWKTLLKGPPQPPLCRGHKEPCVLRTVKKDGPNKGKQFWVCCKPEGPKNNSQARCDHFVWVPNKKC